MPDYAASEQEVDLFWGGSLAVRGRDIGIITGSPGMQADVTGFFVPAGVRENSLWRSACMPMKRYKPEQIVTLLRQTDERSGAEEREAEAFGGGVVVREADFEGCSDVAEGNF